MKTKTFIGVSFVIENNRIAAICSSRPDYEPVKTPKDVLDFFLSLREQTKKSERVVFVAYGLAHDLEFAFQDLSIDLKDRLFEVGRIRKEIAEIERDQDSIFAELRRSADDHQKAELEQETNRLAIADRSEICYEGYVIKSRGGKSLEITKDKKRFVLYDAYGFFRTSLSEAASKWLNQNVIATDNARQAAYCKADMIAELMAALDVRLKSKGINLSRYHGTGSVASWMLNKGKAKESFKSYKYKRMKSFGYDKALLQSYYAGRVEQAKLGSVQRPIYVYDINSAYAYASTLLPVFLVKMKFVGDWQPSSFSLWHCEYDFTKLDLRFGLLPFRRSGSNEVDFRLKGRGFYWQPEIEYVLNRYPNCVKITGGYVLPSYEAAPFTEVIQQVYNKRLECKRNSDPLADVLKLALSSIYGKFCQRHNKGFFTNRAYAGFITSVVRAQMLKAIEGKEESVICFLTDAIHTTEPLDVDISDKLGAFKKKEYSSGFYLDNGVYQLQRLDGTIKQAMRGQIAFDFEKAKRDFCDRYSYKAGLEFLVGHGLYSALPLRYDYLMQARESRRMQPLQTAIRKFNDSMLDGIFESKAPTHDTVSESGIYLDNDFGSAGVSLELLMMR